MASVLQIMRIPLTRGAYLMVGSQTSNAFRSRSVPVIRSFAAKAGEEAPKGASSGGGGGGKLLAVLAGVAMGAAGGYYYGSSGDSRADAKSKCKKVDYQKVYNAIANILEEDPDYDDGSYGPVFVRLAWHASGTYDKNAGNGGSNLGTMRFQPEATHDANAGLNVAREKLEKIKKQFPNISYGDLWTLAGVVSIQEMGGPTIPWRPGRKDGVATDCPPDGRLPDGGNPAPQHARDIFYRMGFTDQEIVALIGAHTMGRCHSNRSGYEGPWTNSPTSFTNSFFKELLERKWVDKNWKGPKQFVDKESGQLMMLPADIAFTKDKEFKKWVDTYAKDENKFFEDFAKAWKKLCELGVPFKEGTKEYVFKSTSA